MAMAVNDKDGMLKIIQKEKKTALLALGLLLIINLSLALSLISWGLPYYLHADEQFVMTNAMRTGENHLLPVTYIYPPAWFYAHLTLYGSYFVLLKVTDKVSTISSFIDFYHSHQSNFMMISRGLSIFVSLLILALVFVFTKKMSNDSIAGLLAVLFLVISPGFLASSTLIKADIVIPLFLLATLYHLIFENGKNDKTTWLALFSALAFSSNYYGAFLAPITIFGFLLLKKKEMIIPYIAKLAVFMFILNFTFLFNLAGGIQDVTFLFNMTRNRVSSLCIPLLDGNQFYSILSFLGAPLVFAAIGFVYYWRQKRTDFMLLGISTLAFVIGFFLISARVPRYSVSVYPLVSIMAAITVMAIYRFLAVKYKSVLPRLGLIVLLLLMLLPTSMMTFGLVTNEDTRFTSASWIKENIPEDKILATETYGPTLYGPKYYTFPYYGKDPSTGKGFYIMKGYYITDLNLDKPDYLILSSLASEKTKYLCDQKPLEVYKAIRSCPLVKEWRAEPETFWFHNPVIELYSNCLKGSGSKTTVQISPNAGAYDG